MWPLYNMIAQTPLIEAAKKRTMWAASPSGRSARLDGHAALDRPGFSHHVFQLKRWIGLEAALSGFPQTITFPDLSNAHTRAERIKVCSHGTSCHLA